MQLVHLTGSVEGKILSFTKKGLEKCLYLCLLPGAATHVIKCERHIVRRAGHSTMPRASLSALKKAGCSRLVTKQGRVVVPVGSLMSARLQETFTLLQARVFNHTMSMVSEVLHSVWLIFVARQC